MRAILLVMTAAIAAGVVFYTTKVSSKNGPQLLLSSYQANPEKTLRAVESGINNCVPGIGKSAVGTKFTRSLIAPMYLKNAELRVNGTGDFEAAMKRWIATNHPEVLSLPDKEFFELAGYMKVIGDDDVEICILSSVA